MMSNSEPSQKISGEIIFRCPECKGVAAWERWEGKIHERSYEQRFKLVLSWRWPFAKRVALPHELKCPNGCN